MNRWIVRERDAERDRVVIFAIDNALADPNDPAQHSHTDGRQAKPGADPRQVIRNPTVE